MLYLIPTPIGNLDDITLRALKAIEACDYLLCEDTRHTRNLLRHFSLEKPLRAYHMFNEAKSAQTIVDDLKSGKVIGLVSDAGTPCISDPGYRLVKRCIEEDLPFTPLPGACAAIVALIGSGFTTERFQFVGFLPIKKGQREKALRQAFDYEGTTIAYESPHRLLSTLTILEQIDPNKVCIIARELTKKFEHFHRGTSSELLRHFSSSAPKGEIVILLPGLSVK